jgi:hypothetical protein
MTDGTGRYHGQTTLARKDKIHLFKDFQYVKSVPRGEELAMLLNLHKWQVEGCDYDAPHVFTVLDMREGYAFHQSAQRITDHSFQTERMFKSDARMPYSEPPFEDLVAKIR